MADLSKEQRRPWWTLTVEVERLMGRCKAAVPGTVVIAAHVLEGLCWDSLKWRAERATQPMTSDKQWRCFHCDEVITGEVDARAHFGSSEHSEPACRLKAPGEFALLQALRNAEDELARYRAEDSDILRAMHSQASDHVVALRREEEKGYARALRDTHYKEPSPECVKVPNIQRVCCYCPQTKDLRPYGPKGAWVCFPCTMLTPERKAEAERQLGALFEACDRQGPIAVLTESGPRPLEKGNG